VRKSGSRCAFAPKAAQWTLTTHSVLIQRAATAVALGKLDVAEAVAKIASAIDLPVRRDRMIACGGQI
jgi:hypothetical protein